VARLTADHLTPAPGKWPKQDLHIGMTYQPWRDVFVYFDNDAKFTRHLTRRRSPRNFKERRFTNRRPDKTAV
jgi:hypothetical protein